MKRRLINLAAVVSLFLALALALAFTPAPLAQAQGDDPTDGWTKHDIDANLDGANSVYVCDIDSDGDPDLVATGGAADDVVWYEAPTWTRRSIDASLPAACAVYVSDIDTDGDPDVVASGNGTVVWYEAPTWTKRDIDSLNGAFVVCVYDIDSDGDPDVVAAGASVVWYEASPDPTTAWIKHDIDTGPRLASGACVYDIDSDGDPDVVATDWWHGEVVWYEAPTDPTGTWTTHGIDAGLLGASGVYVYDIDADGKPDVVAAGNLADDVVWYKAPADPVTGTWIKYDIDTNLDGATKVYVHDMNVDGDPDIVTTGYSADDVVWYEGPYWTKHYVDTDLGGAGGVYIDDIDSDGNPDVVATGYFADDVVWYRIEWESYKTGYFPAGDVWNNFSDHITEHTVYMYGTAFKRDPHPTSTWTKYDIDDNLDGPVNVYVYDIDADGDSDAVLASDAGVVWYQAPDNPTGTWTKYNIDTNLNGPRRIDVYDIDADGNPDVVATGYLDNDVVWYQAPDDPTSTWTKHHIDTNLGYAYGVYVSDIDSDGNPDVVAAGHYHGNVVWYRAPADPTTGAWTKYDIDTLSGAHEVCVHDMDTDGNPDVIVTSSGVSDVVWYKAPADPTTGTWTKVEIDTNLAYANGIAIHDVDADGKPDVVAAGVLADDVVWYRAPADPVTGTWIKNDIDTDLDGATWVSVCDIDSDGNPDVVATGFNVNAVVWYEAPDDSAGTWSKHEIDARLDGAYAVYVSDVDADGNPDVVATGFNADDVVWYELPVPGNTWGKHNVDTNFNGAYGIDVYDIDADGDPDVVAAGYYDDATAWYEAPDDPATGVWNKHNIDTTLSWPREVYVCDIDADGNPDVVAAAGSTTEPVGAVVWFEAPDNPTGSWTRHDIDTYSFPTFGVYVYDIDSDNDPDVVATGEGDCTVAWYEAPADPTGTWTKHDIDTTFYGPCGVYVCDIDADGNPDVVATKYSDPDVVWYEAPADPTGTWMKHDIDSSLSGAYGVDVHDIDSDGNPDVVATSHSDDDVVWYEAPADPTGTWTKHEIDSDLNDARDVYVHDIDSDGDPDVVATGPGADDVVWYEAPADPTGTWTKHEIDINLNNAYGVHVHDIDSNGSPDVVATGFWADDVVWYEFPHGGGKDYKIIFWEGTTTKRQTEIVTAQAGTVKSQQTFVAGIDNPGTWYAGVYDVDYEPSSYNDNAIWTDSFIVEQSATIPSPDIRTPIDSIDFGYVATGGNWDNITTIYNDGSTDLVINNITRLSGSDEFTYVGPATPFYIQPGYSEAITIRFAPTSAGARSATFNVNSNDPDLPDITFDVSGNGAVPATYYVSPTGDDNTGDGSEGAPWRTISKAVTRASDCDIIKVMDDDVPTVDYTENVDVDIQLTIERYNDVGPDPQIEALSTADHVFHVSASKVIIRGLDIGGATDLYMSGVYLDGVDHCTIQNNRCRSNYRGIFLDESSSNTISDNICNGNDDSGISLSGSNNNTLTNNHADRNACPEVADRIYGIKLSGSDYNTLIGNTANENEVTAYYGLSIPAEACGIYLSGSDFNTLISNTANDNTAATGFYRLAPAYARGIYLLNSDFNTVVGNTANSNNAWGWHGIGRAYGIAVSGSTSNTIANNTANDNQGATDPSGSGYGYGICLEYSADNTISGNMAEGNRGVGGRAWGIYLRESTSNIITKNDDTIGLYYSSNDNAIYLNDFGGVDSDSTNNWGSPTPLCYKYTSAPHRSYIGNYYYYYPPGVADADNDGICDDPYYYITDNGNDQNPLWQASGNYSLFAWWLGNRGTMYKGDTSKGPGKVTIPTGYSVTWIADEAAPGDITFPPGQGWTGQVVFTSAPQIGDNFTVEIGSFNDGFAPGGPQATLAGDGSTTAFTYTTNNASFTVQGGHYLALRITSRSAASYDVRVGGAWSYTSAPDVGGPPPDIRTPIDGIDFGDVLVGSDLDDTTTIYNDGPATLIINDITRASGSDEFAYISPETPFDITAGGSQIVTITFAPTSTGAKSATFNVNSNDPDEPDVTFDVSGNGALPDIRTPINPIDFDDVEVGSSSDQTTTIYNDGPVTLTINDITRISGSDEFNYFWPDTPFDIVAGHSRKVYVKFAPTSAGAKSATFNVNSNDHDEPDVTFDVSGNGTVPDIRTPIDPIDFGNVEVGGERLWETAIYNDGTATLIINNITRVSGSDEFNYYAPVIPFGIMAGGSRTVYIRFAPTSSGAKSATFNVSSNDPDEPHVTFDVSGNSTVPDIRTPINPIDFGYVEVGSDRNGQTGICNDGLARLYVNNITRISGSEEFTYDSPATPFTIYGGSCYGIHIVFAPTSTGPKTATFNVSSTDPDEPHVTFDVSGNGIERDIRTPIAPVDFGNVEMDSDRYGQTAIYNDGTVTLHINNITRISGSDEFTYVSPETPFGISGVGGRLITIRFTPTSAGAKSATFNVNSDDPDESDVTFDVSGTGTSPIGIQIDLKAGWNMVSVPLTLADNSTSVVFPGVAGVFAWNATSRNYYEPEVIDPEKGYWVAVTENTTISVNGTPVDTWTIDITAGWNMIGSVATNSSIADPDDNPDGSVIPPAYWWDPVERGYVTTYDVEPGKGYWIPSVNDCTLTL